MKLKYKLKKYILFLFSIFLSFIFFNGITDANWLDNMNKLGGAGTYEEKIQSLSQVLNEDGTVNPGLIYKNIMDLRKLYRKGYLIGGSKKKQLYNAIIKNTEYYLTGVVGNFSIEGPITSGGYYPLLSYTNSDGGTGYYFNFTTKALNKYIQKKYQNDFIKQFFELFGFDKNKIKFGFTFKKYDINGKGSLITIGKINKIGYDMFKGMFFDSELTPYLIIVKMDQGLVGITLKSETNLKTFNEYLSKEDAFAAKNNFTVNGKLQIDSFLVNYCSDNYFTGNENKAINALKNKNRLSCGLIPINIDGTGNDELLLKDDKDYFNIIYSDQGTSTSLRVIKPIFKTNKDIIKFLKNSDGTYSFLATNYIQTNNGNLFNLLMNNSDPTISGNCSQLMLSSIGFSCSNSTGDYIYKNINYNGGLNVYGLNTTYTYSGTSDEGGMLLKGLNGTGYILLNDKYFGFSDKKTDTGDYILFDRKKLGIKKEGAYVNLKKDLNTITISVDGKEYLELNSDGSYTTNFKDYIYTGGNLGNLFKKFNKVTKAGINGSEVDGEKVSAFYFNFGKFVDGKYYLYGILNNGTTNYIGLKQILDLGGSINMAGDDSSPPIASNPIVSGSVNYEDNLSYNGVNGNGILITNKKIINGKQFYVGKDMYVYKNTFFTKNGLLFYSKNIFQLNYSQSYGEYLVSSSQDIGIKGMNLGGYAFLNNCSYEEMINNQLGSCTDGVLTGFDVDNDGYNEWILKDGNGNVKIFNNVITKNSDGTYSINFHEIFRSNGEDYCTTTNQTIPYYNQNGDKCGPNVVSNGNCSASTELIFKDGNGNYLYYKINGDNPSDKQYILDKIDTNSVNCN